MAIRRAENFAIDRRLFIAGGLALAGCATESAPGQTQVAPGVTTEMFDLWPGDPPGSAGVTAVETVVERSKDPKKHDRAVTHVRKPTLKVFRPAKPDGSAVLVLPGGAYQRVVLDKEGDETALRLAQSGVTAAVLVYRLPGDGWAAGIDAPLQDAMRAMRLIRSGKVASGVSPTRCGVLGFSAGGHLAANLAFRTGMTSYPVVDMSDSVSPKPDFVALIYAAYLDGKGAPAEAVGSTIMPNFLAMAQKGAQPMFLVHAKDDPSVPVANTLRLEETLKAAGTPVETHIFDEGGHGFGIANAGDKPAKAWPDMFLAWGKGRGIFG